MGTTLHTDTPTLTAIDPRGLAVRSIALYRSEAEQTAEVRVTHMPHDVMGRLVGQRDPRLAQPNLSTVYSLSEQVLLTDSVDAGWRLALFGEAGQVVTGWDGRGSTRQIEYDPLLRPLSLTENGQITERLSYGGPEAFAHNQCNQPVRHDDTAGTLYWADYGLLGSALNETRSFLQALDNPDWPLAENERDALLEGKPLQTQWTFSALGETVTQTDAMGHAQHSRYTVAGQLKSVEMTLAGAQPLTLLSDIRYNAFEQVEQEAAGNGVVSRSVYAPQDGRLIELSAGLPNGPPLQHLAYSYDPVGNILQIEDHAQPVRFFANQRIEPVNHYHYDTLYQLIEATGREVDTNTSHGPALPIQQNLPPDPNRISHYTQSYDYDAAGNLLQMRHVGAQSFTRTMRVAADSNRSLPEGETDADFDTGFDANGNQLHLIRGQTLAWDLRNQLQQITTVTRATQASDHERYIYDSQGQRCRKINNALTSSRTLNSEVRYLPGMEIRTTADGEVLNVIVAQAGRGNVRILHWLAGLPGGIANDQVRYSLSDHLGSSTLELDQQGALISQESYYPFGGTSWWAARSAVEANYKTVRYSGKERDVSGLYYYGLRYYAPWLQRWINPDPEGDVDGLNAFEALHNNPLNRIDPQGNNSVPTKAHYFWEGSDIAELSLQNILMFKEVNPEYEINLRTSRPAQVLNTLAALKESADPAKRVIANLYGESLNLSDPHELFKDLAQIYPQAEKLESLFARENTGPFKNLAASSDIFELAAMYTEGGLYMDVDVAIGAPLGTLTAKHGFLMYIEDNLVSNAVIAATPQSEFVKRLMDEIVERYTTSPMMMLDNENAGWSKKRSTEGCGLLSRLKLTMQMTGPSMINNFLPPYPMSIESYALPHGTFHHRTETDSTFSRDTPRTLLQIFTQGYTRGLNGEGDWSRIRPGRRASLS